MLLFDMTPAWVLEGLLSEGGGSFEEQERSFSPPPFSTELAQRKEKLNTYSRNGGKNRAHLSMGVVSWTCLSLWFHSVSQMASNYFLLFSCRT